MTGDGPTTGPTGTSSRRRLPPPLGRDAIRAVTLLHNFPGLRHETVARALRLSPMLAAETLALLQRQGLVVFSSETHLGGWASTGLWDPDREPTIEGGPPTWPEEHGPLAAPVEAQ